MRKVLDGISIFSFLISAGMAGTSFFMYKYFSSEQFKAKMMNMVLTEVKGLLPNVLDKGLPETTGISIPTPLKK